MRRILFFLISMVMGLGVLYRFERPSSLTLAPSEVTPSLARGLLESLDRIATLQYAFRATHGHFSGSLSQLKFSLSPSVRDYFELRTETQGQAGFRIIGLGPDGEAASIDEKFNLRGNFSLPPPSADYLQQLALRHLRLVAGRGNAELRESSAFRGFFRYGMRAGDGVAYANGMRSPVVGMYLEQKVSSQRQTTQGGLAVMKSKWQSSTPQELTAAERGFERDLNRYSKQLSDVSDIAEFTYDGLVDFELAGSGVDTPSAPAPTENERSPASQIVVEPIASEN